MGACISAEPRSRVASGLSTSSPTADKSIRSRPAHRASKNTSKSESRGKSKKKAPVDRRKVLGLSSAKLEEKYLIGREIGRGLYGVVRVVMDKHTRQRFACKTIDKRRLGASQLAKLRGERDALKRVAAMDAVAKLVDQFEDAMCVHFVLELCTGGTLYDIITMADIPTDAAAARDTASPTATAATASQQRLDERQAAQVTRQLASAVADLHLRGLMHRDIKLENIGFMEVPRTEVEAGRHGGGSKEANHGSSDTSTSSALPSIGSSSSLNSDSPVLHELASDSDSECGEVAADITSPTSASPVAPPPPPVPPLKLLDFGLATSFSPGQLHSDIAGTAYYVAPEVLQQAYGHECDVWSMGVVLYMMLAGAPPFWDVSEEGICAAVLAGQYDISSGPWKSISLQAKDLVQRMLHADPSQRITAQDILENEWMQL